MREHFSILHYAFGKNASWLHFFSCFGTFEVINTRARAAQIFKTIIPKSEKHKNSVLYIGAIKLNNLPVNLRNIETYDSFKNIHKRNMLL